MKRGWGRVVFHALRNFFKGFIRRTNRFHGLAIPILPKRESSYRSTQVKLVGPKTSLVLVESIHFKIVYFWTGMSEMGRPMRLMTAEISMNIFAEGKQMAAQYRIHH
uniref:Uncharacterized protein n=1 Tax=Parascaris univalens TaxID=6257 RepID=A0A915C0Z6_PARUN